MPWMAHKLHIAANAAVFAGSFRSVRANQQAHTPRGGTPEAKAAARLPAAFDQTHIYG